MAEASAATLVEYTREGQVAILTLNRPEKLNAFNDYLVRQLADALRRFDLDPKAQIAVICGSGRVFSSGAGVHQRRLRKREEFLEHGGPQGWGANSGDLLTRSVNWKPVIAAPRGYAMGLALGIVLECDLIVATWYVQTSWHRYLKVQSAAACLHWVAGTRDRRVEPAPIEHGV